MALRKRKPTSPGRRFQTVSDFAEVTAGRPERSLVVPKPRTGGRNANGRKTARQMALFVDGRQVGASAHTLASVSNGEPLQIGGYGTSRKSRLFSSAHIKSWAASAFWSP